MKKEKYPWQKSKGRKENRFIRNRILIICEGAKTEVNYFKKFPETIVLNIDVKGIGRNTLSLVYETMKHKKYFKNKYNEIWCVFDKDEFPDEQFAEAIKVARNNNIRIAYSNPSFELWYLLHYDCHKSSISRQICIDKLSKKLGYTYDKNDRRMYDKLEGLQQDAIDNAIELINHYEVLMPERANPSTLVHILVERLNELREVNDI